MKLRDLRRGQDYLMRGVRHLANRAAVVKEGKLHWIMSPEADADGIMTRLWQQLEAVAQRHAQPARSKTTPRRKCKEEKSA